MTHAGSRAWIFGLVAAAALTATSALADEAGQLVSFEIIDNDSIETSLTGQPGDPENGRAVAIDRRKGNCLACHVMPIPEQDFQGETGPALIGVADRLTEGQLRLQIVNSKVVYPDTYMPAFYRVDGLNNVKEEFQGKTILTAQEVEDVVAYLMTLKYED